MKNIPIYIIGAIVAILLFAMPVKAQQQMKFSHTEWDFGEIKEENGKVTHSFTFVNNAKTPLTILRVVATCGCTTPSYQRTPIMPGKTGEISVTYDPESRPGRFSKNITIKNSLEEEITLVVEGNVIPRPKSIEELYPFVVGEGVRLSSNFHAFSYVGRGEEVSETIQWINTSQQDVKVRFIPQKGSGLLSIKAPQVLKAGTNGVITIKYAIPQNSTFYGTANDVVAIEVNGEKSRTVLSANVIAVDRHDRMEEDLSLPAMAISKKIVKFAEVKHPSRVSNSTVVITNEGGSDLIIRAVEYPTDILGCSLSKGDRIAAGESRKVTFTFRSETADFGPFSERVRIITNDVVRPMQAIRVTAIVVKRD